MEHLEQKFKLSAPYFLVLPPCEDDLKVIGDYHYVSGKSYYKTYKSMLKWLSVRHRNDITLRKLTTDYILIDYGHHPQNGYYIEREIYNVYDASGSFIDKAYKQRTVFVADAFKYGRSYEP